MRVVSISEIKALEAGELVPSTKGKVIEVGKLFSGTNDKGPWSLQTITIDDGSNKIKAKLWNRDELAKTWKGVEVYLCCVQGEKGLHGIKAEDDTYKGATTRIITVTGKAELTAADAAPAQAAPVQPPTAPVQPPTAPTAPVQPPQPAPTGPVQPPATAKPVRNDLHDAKVTMNRIANLYLHSLEAATYVRGEWKEKHGTELTQDQFQACVASIFIESNRHGLARMIPAGKFNQNETSR
jgi:hypothetical protein